MDAAQRARRDVVLQGLDVSKLKGVEIGALHRPLIEKSESEVYYLDHCSTEDLKKKYASDPNVDVGGIVDVDFVWSDQPAAQTLETVCPLDYVVASHVIEHVPDLIGWLLEMRDTLRDGGSLVLAVPDKRFTFDIQRRTTAIEEVRGAYKERRRRPGLRCIMDHYANVVRADVGTLWLDYAKADECPFYHDPSFLSLVDSQYAEGRYIDVHCWVFTPWSFLQNLGKIVEETGLGFDLAAFQTTPARHLEFYVRLVKVAKSTTNWQALAANARAEAIWPPTAVEPAASLLDQRLAPAAAENARLEQANNQLTMQLTDALRRAEQAERHSAQLMARVTALENSTSWRVTAPIRAAKGILGTFS